MKIPLKVEEDIAGATRITTHLFLRSEDKRIVGIIKAIIDTGCPETIISSEDRKRIRVSSIAIDSLEGKEGDIILAGEKIDTKKIEKMFINIRGYEIEMPIYISLKTTAFLEKEEYPIPSIIGMDFLLKTGFTLVFNPRKKLAYFETN